MIYLDNAATSFPKPDSVVCAVVDSIRLAGGNPGRSSHRLASEAAKRVYDCRESVARLFHGSPENVVFTYNATYALNIALKAFARRGCHVLMSDMEHNSVARPVYSLDGKYSLFEASSDVDAVLDSVRRAVTPFTRVLICTLASNICNVRLPASAIGHFCRDNNIVFIADASQCAGSADIDIERDCIDVLCAPSHKGLFGICGGGFALFSSRVKADSLCTLIQGGSGSASFDKTMPTLLPERFEAGTVGVPSIAALNAGIRFVEGIGVDAVFRHERFLCDKLRDMLCYVDRVRLYGEGGGSVLLFNVDGAPSSEVSAWLDKHGIASRSGFHCAPLAHTKLRTGDNGAVRLSFSPFNSPSELDSVWRAVKEFAANYRADS